MTVGDDYDEDYLINEGGRPDGRKRYIMFLINLTAVIPIVVAFMYWNECQAIETLQWYLVIFGAFGVANAFLKFHFRVSSNPRKQRKDCVTNFSNLVGIGQLLIAVWGAVISWHRIPDMHDINCNLSMFTCAVISSAICCFILFFIVIFIIVQCIKACRGRGQYYDY